jgi:hypothetical protein
MKRILFLFFIATGVYADVMSDLEKAVMKSDLPAIEQMLDSDISISLKEQISLITFAADIIKKRENKIGLNEIKLLEGKNFELKYVKNDKEVEAYGIKGAGFLFLSSAAFIAAFVSTEVGERVSFDRSIMLARSIGITLFAVSALSFVVSIANIGKSISREKEVIAKYRALYNARYKAAIKIKQLLFKIKTRSDASIVS